MVRALVPEPMRLRGGGHGLLLSRDAVTARSVARAILVYGAAFLLASAVSHVQSPSVAAWCPIPGPDRWQENVYNMHIQDFVPKGWENAIVASAKQWNGTSKVHYWPVIDSPQYWNFNFDTRDFLWYGWNNAAPGITRNYNHDWLSGRHNNSDVSLNTNFTWNLVGNMNQAQMKADVRTVSVHEIGHSTGLDHPKRCGPPVTVDEQNAAMTVAWVQRWTTRVDDDNGNRALYP